MQSIFYKFRLLNKFQTDLISLGHENINLHKYPKFSYFLLLLY